MNKKTVDFKNMLRLLDDEDENIYAHIKKEYISHGNAAAEFLKAYTEDENPIISLRAGEIVSEIYFKDIDKKISGASLQGGTGMLEDIAFLIAEFEYPELDTGYYRGMLDSMTEDIKQRLSATETLAPGNIISIINRYLFFEKGFKGNSNNFYEPENTYINDVLERKTGIPVTLSLIYILLARRLELPVFGVNMPVHFIIKYLGEEDEIFIDPFNKGIAVSKKEAAVFLKRMGVSKEDFENFPYLDIAGDREIISRMLRNLIEIYKKQNNALKAEMLEKLNSYFEDQ